MTNRIVPGVGAEHYQTFQIKSPISTHWRKASCEEVGCSFGEQGWTTRVDETTELGRRQAYYIRRKSGRKFTETREPAGITAFVFASGQDCFTEHKTRLERQELYVIKGGDWRGNPRRVATRTHTKPEHWVEEFAENQDNIKNLRERG